MGQNTNITVTVDTKNINQGNKDKHVSFSDNRGGTQPDGQPENFLSKVSKNMKVVWEGKSVNGTDSIEIVEVSRNASKGGVEILENSKNKGENGKVEAKVKDYEVKGDEIYDITFTINGEASFTIDPKLRMSTE